MAPVKDETILVSPDGEGERVDRYLVREGVAFASRSQVQGLIATGNVRINGRSCTRAATRLAAGDRIDVTVPCQTEPEPQPENIPLDIVYEDAALLVVNKPRGMVVHPAPGNSSGTLVNALLAYDNSITAVGEPSRPGIVHRLDKETSGLMIVAKQHAAYVGLVDQLKARLVGRQYVAFVHGVVKDDRWTVNAPLARDPLNRQRMAVVDQGKQAITHFQALERYERFSVIEARLVTGRTHQIRVHSAHLGHPVVGDVRYGARAKIFNHGQALHACRIQFHHPITDETMAFEAPLPEELVLLQKRLQKKGTVVSAHYRL